MKFNNKAKPIKFSLLVGGRECRSVEDLKMVSDFNSLLESINNGNLAKWLKQINASDYLEKLDNPVFKDENVLKRNLALYNLFSSEPLLLDNIDNEGVISMLAKGIVTFSDLQNTDFSSNFEIKKAAINYVDNVTLNQMCESDLDFLRYYYQEKSHDTLNTRNARTLINEKIVTDDILVREIATKHHLSDIVLDLLSKGTIDNDQFNQLCEKDLELLRLYYEKNSYANLNETNSRRLIDAKIVTDDKEILAIASQKNLSDVMERYGQLTIKVGDTSFEMILVQGYEGGDFYIGKYPVTQAQWKAIMGDNPSNFQGDDLPVESVNWNQAKEFADKLILMTDKFFRLPEAKEWEYAAKGGNRSQGYKYSGSNVAHKVAWYDANSVGRTHPVGKKEPNELGIYDMSGNVREWSNSDTYEGRSDIKNFCGCAYDHSCNEDFYRIESGLFYKSQSNLGFRLALSV